MCPSILSEFAVKALLGFIALKQSPKRAPVKTHFEEQKPYFESNATYTGFKFRG